MKKIILTGDRPTGKLHVGHYVGSLSERVKLQNSGLYDEINIMIADAQALTDNAEHPEKVRSNILQVALDYLACGIDPEKSTIFIQSMVPQLTELSFYYQNLVTVSRLQRNPTVKSEIQMRNFETSIPVGFFCYPISQAADITAFKATDVPVGEDQEPMLEQCREIVHKFNSVYGDTLVEPKIVLPSNKACLRLPGIDGKAKMSKSLGNSLLLEDLLKKYSAETIKFALLQTNYRADINVTDDLFPTAEKHLVDFYRVLEEAEKSGLESSKKTEKIGEDFVNCMDDDFNTALAISNLFGYFKNVRKKLKEGDVTAIEDINAIRENYDILGLFRADAKEFLKKYDKADAEDNVSVPEEIFALAEKRKAAKAEKNYALADEIRKEIADKGFILVDTKDGFTIKKA